MTYLHGPHYKVPVHTVEGSSDTSTQTMIRVQSHPLSQHNGQQRGGKWPRLFKVEISEQRNLRRNFQSLKKKNILAISWYLSFVLFSSFLQFFLLSLSLFFSFTFHRSLFLSSSYSFLPSSSSFLPYFVLMLFIQYFFPIWLYLNFSPINLTAKQRNHYGDPRSKWILCWGIL